MTVRIAKWMPRIRTPIVRSCPARSARARARKQDSLAVIRQRFFARLLGRRVAGRTRFLQRLQRNTCNATGANAAWPSATRSCSYVHSERAWPFRGTAEASSSRLGSHKLQAIAPRIVGEEPSRVGDLEVFSRCDASGPQAQLERF